MAFTCAQPKPCKFKAVCARAPATCLLPPVAPRRHGRRPTASSSAQRAARAVIIAPATRLADHRSFGSSYRARGLQVARKKPLQSDRRLFRRSFPTGEHCLGAGLLVIAAQGRSNRGLGPTGLERAFSAAQASLPADQLLVGRPQRLSVKQTVQLRQLAPAGKTTPHRRRRCLPPLPPVVSSLALVRASHGGPRRQRGQGQQGQEPAGQLL